MTNNEKDMLILLFFALVVAIALSIIPNSHPPRTELYYKTHIVEQGETLGEIVEEYHGSLKKTLAEHPNSYVIPGERVRVVIEQ